MKTIITSIRANNQATFRYVSRPSSLCPRRGGDGSLEYKENLLNKTIQRVEDFSSIMAASCPERIHEKILTYVKSPLLPSNQYADIGTEPITYTEHIRAVACDIPTTIKYYDDTRDTPIVVRTTYQELVAQRKIDLDIIAKSQQVKKYERPWGKVQTPKSFTRNAKQKILEAGAVVDKHVGKHGSYELTLTIPGSGAVVYDQVARWSGYIVNRMLQVIRRLDKKGYPIHWFFVWEHQKRGALHMHWCIAIKDEPMLTDYVCRLLKDKWFQLLQELSDKTGVDLFRRKGFTGSWKDNPEVWQSSISPVRKSVAAYFSKYMSKNLETSAYNKARKAARDKRRKGNDCSAEDSRILSLCPSRYWGCSQSVRFLTKQYSVTTTYEVGSKADADFLIELLQTIAMDASKLVCRVARDFLKADETTGFIYAKGYEHKLWFDPETFDNVVQVFKRIHMNRLRKTDAIGAMLELAEF